MNLWMKLAFQKLLNNRKKTLKKALFFGVIFSVVTILILLLKGTETQMSMSNRNSNGDVTFLNKNRGDSLNELYDHVLSEYSAEMEAIIPGVTMEGDINSSTAYVKGKCIGVTEEFYSYNRDLLGWIEKSNYPLQLGYCLIEGSMARNLGVVSGDYITIKYVEDETGVINTLDLEVDGIFTGNKLLYENSIIANIQDIRNLKMVEDDVNRVRLYFKSRDLDKIRAIALDIKKEFFKIVDAESATLDPTGGIMGIFEYYKYLLTFVLSMIIFVFLIILNFSNQNIMFMEFRSRKAELSTLLTYGIRIKQLRVIVFFETLFVFILSFTLSILFTWVLTYFLGFIELKTLELADVIAILGGPTIVFTFDLFQHLTITGILLLITIYSGQKGAGNYLKMEIREIISTSK